MLGKKKGEFNGDEVIAEFERLTRDAAAVQRETLRRILAGNAAAEYLQRLGLAGRDPDAFRACVPLATHDDLEPYIARIAGGDTSPVLTATPVTSISLSSGTTQGKRKYLPFNDDLFNLTMHVYRTSFAFRNKAFPVDGGGKALQFVYGSRRFITNGGGLTATTATTNLYRHEGYKAAVRGIQLPSCSPDEVIFGPDFAETLYCHLLCGLLFSGEVQTVFSMFGHNLVLALETLERVWEELCDDIRRGAPSPARVTDPAVRRAVSALLAAPNPALAGEVARKLAGLATSGWRGAIPALWPNARYVHTIVTGSMEHYIKKLRHYAGGLPLVAMDYGASEGMIGANVEPEIPPESATFAVLPNIAYFEFIPLKIRDGGAACSDDANYAEVEPVGLTEVTAGEHYELVMTTFAGLYRYRMGDVVKVVGFYNSTPKLKFVCRGIFTLSINVDKNNEQDVQLAINGTTKILAAERLEVLEYTSYADVSSNLGHYVIFWELNAEANDSVLQSCCNEIDRGFIDAGYVSSRKTRAIGPLELQILKPGTFQKVLDHYLSLGAPINQFKLPRCVARSNTNILQILSGSAMKVFFSTAYE